MTDEGMQKLPIGKGSAEKVVVKYPSTSVATRRAIPGRSTLARTDASKHSATIAAATRSRSLVIATWAGYKMAGPLLVSTEHRGTADGKPFHLSFTNVAVKLAGSNTWTEAK